MQAAALQQLGLARDTVYLTNAVKHYLLPGMGHFTYNVIDGVIHYCVANMPGAVPRTSTFALNNVTLPFALAEMGLIDEYEFVVQPILAGHGPTLFAGLSKHVDLKLVGRREFKSGAVALRYEAKR